MKLTGAQAAGYVSRPDPQAAGLLIYGADAMRVAIKRKDVLENLLGPQAEEEMRLTRMTGAELRSDPARLSDAVKAVGFFPGPRAAFVEEATDGLAPVFEAALADWQPGDAQIIATARALAAKSKLRKLFETSKTAFAMGVYDDPPGRAEIEALIAGAGLKDVSREAMTDIEALARALDPGDLRQVIEKLGIYKIGDATPVTPEDIAAIAPATVEAEIDDILDAVAGASAGAVGPLVARLGQQGVGAVSICLAAERHFRALHAAVSHPDGAAKGVASLRPPVFGPRRDKLIRQAQAWGRDRLEYALSLLLDTDLALRSTSRAPQMAVMERALIRLAMLPRSR